MKKVLIGCGIILILGIVLVLAGWLWLQSNKEELQARGEEMKKQGAEFGAGTDHEGCLVEALDRGEADGGLLSEALHGIFLGACLEASSPTPGFCDGVPAPTAIMATVRWRIRICEQHGRSAEGSCGRLVDAIQEFCAGAS